MLAKGFSRILLVFFTLFRAFVGLLPLRVVIWLGATIGSLIGRNRTREIGVNLAQIRAVQAYLTQDEVPVPPALKKDLIITEQTAEHISQATFSHVGQAVAEAMILPKLTRVVRPGNPPKEMPDIAHVEAVGEEIAHEIIEGGSGAVALSGHIGCIELLAAYHVRCGIPLSVVARLPNYPSMAIVLDELRKSYGVETIWREDPASPRKFLEALRGKRVIAALIDQDTKLENLHAPFFGSAAASPIMPIKLAIKHKMPILTSFIVRTEPTRHLIVTERVPYEAENPNAPQEVLNIYSRRLEELICRYPEQWIWWHRRWRRRPEIDYKKNPEKLRSSKEYVEWLNSTQLWHH